MRQGKAWEVEHFSEVNEQGIMSLVLKILMILKYTMNKYVILKNEIFKNILWVAHKVSQGATEQI